MHSNFVTLSASVCHSPANSSRRSTQLPDCTTTTTSPQIPPHQRTLAAPSAHAASSASPLRCSTGGSASASGSTASAA